MPYALLQMAEHDPQLEVAGTASSGAEADLMCQRLAEAGIRATSQRAIGGPEWGTSGGQYVYVEKHQLERAREILAAPSDVSDDELAAMAEAVRAPVTPPPAIEEPAGMPTPKRSIWDRVLGRAARTSK
jgi:hypothetical protein